MNQFSHTKAKLNLKTKKKLDKLREIFVTISDRIAEVEQKAKDLGASSLLGCTYMAVEQLNLNSNLLSAYLMEDYDSDLAKMGQLQTQMQDQAKPAWEIERDQDLNKLEKDMNELLQLYVQMNELIQVRPVPLG